MTKEQRKNSFEHDDLEAVLSNIEGFEDEQQANRLATMTANSALAVKIKDEKKRAYKELNIPRFVLTTALATKAEVKKKLDAEAAIEEIAAAVPEDGIELWADTAGQLSFLQPLKDESTSNVVVLAASKAKTKAQANHEAEQKAGAELVDSLTKH